VVNTSPKATGSISRGTDGLPEGLLFRSQTPTDRHTRVEHRPYAQSVASQHEAAVAAIP